ncbi:MAG: N-formylglutamate amidohydrolase [Hyphomicrobiales bacterium]|nr:N-formylglutamate amidohydrolase [Hyphomicrobiales bacterium]
MRECGETAAAEPELAHPVEVVEPSVFRSPLVLSSPHSGCAYPKSFLSASRLDPAQLRRSEDAFVDELFAGAYLSGAPLVRAIFPRAFLDANREPFELDPRMFDGRLPAHANTRSLRVAAGLGTIARLVAESQEIYARRLPVEAALRRIAAVYRPYHGALRRLTQRAQKSFGLSVLVDCHSMPSVVAGVGGAERIRTDFVLGDRYGTSCDPDLTATVEAELKRRGYTVQRNKPYAGGFITEHYGNPASNAHALQIEINRGVYMSEATFEKLPAFPKLTQDLTAVIATLSEAAQGLASWRSAAE